MSLVKTLFLLFALIIILTTIIYTFDRTIRRNYIEDFELRRKHQERQERQEHDTIGETDE